MCEVACGQERGRRLAPVLLLAGGAAEGRDAGGLHDEGKEHQGSVWLWRGKRVSAGRRSSRCTWGGGMAQSSTASAVQASASRRGDVTPSASPEKPRLRLRIRAWPQQNVLAEAGVLKRRIGRTRPLRNRWSRSTRYSSTWSTGVRLRAAEPATLASSISPCHLCRGSALRRMMRGRALRKRVRTAHPSDRSGRRRRSGHAHRGSGRRSTSVHRS